MNSGNIRYIILFWLPCLLGWSCNSAAPSAQPDISFYYWKTQFRLSDYEQELLDIYKVQRLYVRYFDINVIQEQGTSRAVPQAVIAFDSQAAPAGTEIVPVIFIRNAVMEDRSLSLDSLARNTWQLVSSISNRHHISIRQVQLDCDWTVSSGQRFFDFTDKLAQLSGVRTGSTVRLHQVKHFKVTGIPPVDTPVLMYYNMGDIESATGNSIYEKAIADKYNKSLRSYPRPLAVAIPVYSWFIHSRNGKIQQLYSKKSRTELEASPGFRKKDDTFYEAVTNHIFWGTYFKKGDLLKYEHISEKDLETIFADLGSHLRSAPGEVILYDLDELNFTNQQYEKDIFKKMARHFK